MFGWDDAMVVAVYPSSLLARTDPSGPRSTKGGGSKQQDVIQASIQIRSKDSGQRARGRRSMKAHFSRNSKELGIEILEHSQAEFSKCNLAVLEYAPGMEI